MTPGKFIGTLFQSRDLMHLAHLQTMSFAEHKALNIYYDEILDLTDKFTEAYFGRNKRCEITIPESLGEDPIPHLKGLRSIMDNERENYPSELQNIIDEMIALVDKILYLLTLN
jgi:hypothetical protein